MTDHRIHLPAAPTRRIATAIITLAASWSLSTSSAQASCGDYVMLGNGDSHGMHSEQPGDPAVPACHGPNCHRRAPLPAAPERMVRIPGADAWTGPQPPAIHGIPGANLLEQATLRLPVPPASRIDRPPKAAV